MRGLMGAGIAVISGHSEQAVIKLVTLESSMVAVEERDRFHPGGGPVRANTYGQSHI